MYHLALVNHGDVVPRGHIELFRRRGDVGIRGASVLLLAGRKAALHARVKKGLLSLEGEETQRCEIYARFGADKPLKPRIGLPGVRAAEVDDKAAAHSSGGGVFVLRIQRDEERKARPYRAGNEPYRIYAVYRAGEKLIYREVLEF